jgi:enoyl-CoA hydratase
VSITSTTSDRVTVLTIDRTQRRNALNHDALDELDGAISAAAEGSRAIVLTGAGGHFCAGADLTELEDVGFTDRLAEVLTRLTQVPVTTVAAISGSCMGLGMQLAVACDLRVVADDARFAVPVARLGLMVDHWTLDRVARFWGEGAARHMVLTGAVLSAEDAWRLGFTQVRGDLDAAIELAGRAADLAPMTQAGSKLGFDAHSDNHTQVARYEAAFAEAWSSDDLAEGRSAFRERRAPQFQGR